MLRSSILFASFLIFLVFASSCSNEQGFEAEVWDYIPARTAVMIEFEEGARSLIELSQHDFIDVPSAYPAGRTAVQRLREVFPLSSIDDSWPMPQELLMVLATAGADRYECAFLFQPGELDIQTLQDLLKTDEWQQQSYSASNFVSSSSELGDWFLADLNGIWFLSTSKLLLEEAIRKSEQKANIPLSEGLQRLVKSADGSSDLHLYMQLDEARSLWKYWFERSHIPELQGLNDWVSVDVALKEEGILFSGILNEQADGVPDFMRQLEPEDFSSAAYIPTSAISWSCKRLSTSPDWNDQRLRDTEVWLNESAPMGSFFLGSSLENAYLQPVFFMSSHLEAIRELVPSIESVSLTTNVYRDVEILTFDEAVDLSALFPLSVFKTTVPHFCMIDQVIYAASSSDALKTVINDLQAGADLEDRYGRNAEDHFPTGKAHRHIAFQNPGLNALLMQFVNGRNMPSLAQSEEQLSGLRAGGISLLQREGRTYIKGSLYSGELPDNPIQNNWTTGLDDDIISGPHAVRSHIGGRYAFIVQDTNFTLYMLNLKGEVEWKTQLDGRILGPPQVIDKFKNDKLQYVMNTAGSIHALDRLGRSLSGFPVSLGNPATAGLQVVDYDRARNYRILVPCGKKLLNYNVDGKEVQGWLFSPMTNDIYLSPLLLQSNQKDYICVQSSDGKLRMTGRTGKARLSEDVSVKLHPGNQWWINNTGNPKLDGLTGLSADGKLLHVFLNGTIDSSDVEADWFRLFEDYAIRVQGNTVEALLPTGESFNTKRNGARWAYIKPLVFQASFYILALDADRNELHLLDLRGKEPAGFPLYAEGNFTAGDFSGNGQLQIVCTGSSGSVISYRIFLNEE